VYGKRSYKKIGPFFGDCAYGRQHDPGRMTALLLHPLFLDGRHEMDYFNRNAKPVYDESREGA